MEHKHIERNLAEFNSILKENDDIYRCAVKSLGLPDCAFWILYTIRVEAEPVTQREICDAVHLPKQTVNSALKKLEQDEIIIMKETGNRRSKRLVLTEKGAALAQKTVDCVIDAEQSAISGMTGAEQEEFLKLIQKYMDLLKASLRTVGLYQTAIFEKEKNYYGNKII